MKSLQKQSAFSRSLRGFILLVVGNVSHVAELSDMDLHELSEVDVFVADIFQAHLHQKDEWMLAYHFEIMHMQPIALGKDELTSQQVLDQ